MKARDEKEFAKCCWGEKKNILPDETTMTWHVGRNVKVGEKLEEDENTQVKYQTMEEKK